MPATSTPVPSGESRRVGTLSVLALQVLLVALGTVAWLVGSESPAGYETTARLAALGAPAAAFVLGVAMWVVKLARRRRRSRTRETLAWIESLHLCAGRIETRAVSASTSSTARADEGDGSAAVSRRALELQVSSLEAALEEQQQRTEDVRLTIEGQLAVAGRRDQERAVLTVQALRSVLVAQPGVVAVNRVEAALNRMGATPSFARPVLATDPSGSPAVVLRSLQLVPPSEDAGAAGAPVVGAGAVVSEQADEPRIEAEPAHADDREETAESPAAARPVLPVPPPRATATASASRSRRRLRRTVAA